MKTFNFEQQQILVVVVFFYDFSFKTSDKVTPRPTYRPRELEGYDDLPGLIVPVRSGLLAALELKSIPTDNLSSFRAVCARSVGRDLRLVFL